MMPDVGELMNESSVILASGIIVERSEDVITAFEEHGFEIVERIDENGWCALAVKKK
jgi:ribosomal protein L11 methyltransferase